MGIFMARLFDELTPLYPDTNPQKGGLHLTTAGANGSYAGVHIAVSGLLPGIPLTLEVKGPHRAYKLFALRPVPVEVNTGADQRSEYLKNDRNDNVIRRAPFLVYDVLEPIFNIVLPSLTTAAFCFRTPIEYCREKETKDWTITLRHGDGEEVLHFTVEQYPSVLPKAGPDTYPFVNWFSFSNIALWHNAPKWSERYEQMLEKYLRAAVYTRQNILALPCGEYFELDEDGNPRLNTEHLSTLLRIARAAGIGLFEGGAFCGRATGQADDDEFYRSLDHAHFTTPEQINDEFKRLAFSHFDFDTEAKFELTGELISGGRGREQLRSALRQLNGYLEAHDLKKCWTQFCLDEPNDALAETYRQISDLTREELPGVPIIEPVLPTERVAGMLDIWCPSTDVYERNRGFYEGRAAQGERLYVYTCLTPGGNYCNRMLDLERLRIVWLSWAPILYPHVEGYLHWGANQGNGNPFTRQAAMFSEQVLEYHPKYANFLPAGDAAIFYPGFELPLTSVRSEAHRIGFEDLCLLQEVRGLAPEKADEIVRRVFRGYADYSKSVEEYRAARRALLEAALELGSR